MGYLNGKIGYRDGILESRSVIKRGDYALLDVDGLVQNDVPGFENTDVSILGSPLLGCQFVDYYVTVHPGGKLTGMGGDGVQTFLFIKDGEVIVETKDGDKSIKDGGYIYLPADQVLKFENKGDEKAVGYLYKRRYEPLEGFDMPEMVVGNIHELEYWNHEDMENVHVTDLLPAAEDMGFDFNFHILSFDPGASHGFLETHIQEHSAWLIEGRGVYNLGNEWMPVEEGDYIYMGPYTIQGAYGVGKDTPLTYIYSKDCNRDAKI